jgi:anti-anti-sigma factor
MPRSESSGLTLDITSANSEQLVLALHGDVDLDTASDLKTLIALSLAAHPCAELILDMFDVGLVDSTGLRLLRDLALDPAMSFALTNPPAMLVRLLDLTLLNATIPVR